MADDSSRKRRGRYKEYMRHSNPYKFAAARRRKTAKSSLHKADRSRSVYQNGCNNSESEFDNTFEHVCTTNTSQGELFIYEQIQDISETTNASPEEFGSDEVQGIDDPGHFEFEDMHDEDESDVTHCNIYERFVMDEEAGSDIFTDCEEDIYSDSESIPEQSCDTENDDILYSGAPITSSSSIVLLLSFVFKHKLTREAFSDLLAVIEAHCPRPNSCKTTVKKLFEFVSQAKGEIVKHYFCGYCKAYYGRCNDRSLMNGNCNICGKSIQKSGGFFIEVPLANQLQKFFSGK